MSEDLTFFAIKDPQGYFWKTPNGKSSWDSVGAAKNAWNAHNHAQEPYDYGGVLRDFRWIRKNWSKDAATNGWSVVKVKYKLVEEINE